MYNGSIYYNCMFKYTKNLALDVQRKENFKVFMMLHLVFLYIFNYIQHIYILLYDVKILLQK
jgi:hypothetical protein